jgi:hypothetical protein
MRLELLQQVIDHVFVPPKLTKLTLRDVERGLREVMRDDPLKAERSVGQMYGHVFKRKEALRDGKRVCAQCHTIAPPDQEDQTTCLSCLEPLPALGPHDRPDCPCGHPPYESWPCAGCNCADDGAA